MEVGRFGMNIRSTASNAKSFPMLLRALTFDKRLSSIQRLVLHAHSSDLSILVLSVSVLSLQPGGRLTG